MATPDYNSYCDQFWGWPEETDCSAFFGAASNVVIGTNPAYAISDFLNIYPKFGTPGPPLNLVLPQAVLQMYVTLASSCLQQARWLEMWPMGMALFIAHFATLYMVSEGNASTTPGGIARSGLAAGIIVAQSAGDVSKSVDPLQVEGFAQWNFTIYGQQFAQIAKVIGAGPMLIY